MAHRRGAAALLLVVGCLLALPHSAAGAPPTWAALDEWMNATAASLGATQPAYASFGLLVGNTSGVVYRGTVGGFNTSATLVNAGAASQWVTAAMVLQILRANGTITLDRRARDFIALPPLLANVTLRQLLSHTAGLDGRVGCSEAALTSAVTAAAGLNFSSCVDNLRVAFNGSATGGALPTGPLGTKHVFTGAALQLAGAAAMAIDAKTYNRFSETAWAAAFGTYLRTPLGLRPGLVYYLPLDNPSLAGGLHTSADNFGAWLEAYLAGDLLPVSGAWSIFTMEDDATPDGNVTLVASALPAGATYGSWHAGLGHYMECRNASAPCTKAVRARSMVGGGGFYPIIDRSLGLQSWWAVLAVDGGSAATSLALGDELWPLVRAIYTNRSLTQSPVPTTSPTASRSATPTGSPSGSASPAGTPPPSTSPSLTASATGTQTATQTGTHTPTESSSQSGTASATQSGTLSASRTRTPSASPTGTPSQSATGTASSSQTRTASLSQTRTFSSSQTGTTSTSQSGRPSSSVTASQTGTASASRTGSQTGTASSSRTASQTVTASSSLRSSQTGTLSSSQTVSQTGTALRSPTESPSLSQTCSPSVSVSATLSASASSTASPSGTLSPSPSSTPPPSATPPPSTSRTGSGTPSRSRSSAASRTRSGTPPPTPPRTPTPSPPICRGLPAVTPLTGTNGSAPLLSTASFGNAGMYTSGSCAAGFRTFFPGSRLVYALYLGDGVPVGGTLTLTTCGLTSADTVLYVGTGCPTAGASFGCLVGADDAAAPPCGPNALASTLKVTAAQRNFFVQLGGVNGRDVSSGLAWAYAAPLASQSVSRAPSRSRTGSRTRSRSTTRSRTRKPK